MKSPARVAATLRRLNQERQSHGVLSPSPGDLFGAPGVINLVARNKWACAPVLLAVTALGILGLQVPQRASDSDARIIRTLPVPGIRP